MQMNVHRAEALKATAAPAAAVTPTINGRGSRGDIFRGAFQPEEEIC